MKRLGWLQYFVWVPVFGILVGAGALAAQAQIIFSYKYVRHGQSRTYNSCTYFGRTGFVSVPADAGQCPWLRFPMMGGR